MNNDYSIDEILKAVDDLQKIKEERKKDLSNLKNPKIDTSDIPKKTLNLIEEAENSKLN